MQNRAGRRACRRRRCLYTNSLIAWVALFLSLVHLSLLFFPGSILSSVYVQHDPTLRLSRKYPVVQTSTDDVFPQQDAKRKERSHWRSLAKSLPSARVSATLRESALNRSWAKDRHPCRKHFIDVCGKTGNPTLSKASLLPKWPKPLKILGLRQAVREQNERQRNACQGDLVNSRLLVFACSNDPKFPSVRCPALADGFRGITLAFIIALLEKRSFFIHSLDWLPFEKFLPARMNYRLEKCPALMKPEIINATFRSVVTYNLPEDRSANCQNIRKFRLLNSTKQVLSMQSNQLSECWYRLLHEAGYSAKIFKHESVTRLVFETLFDFPGEELEQILQHFLKAEKIDLERSVCLHVRSASFPGADEGYFHKNIDDVWRCARAMEISSNRLSHLKNITWIIMGDNDLHKQMALDYITKCSDPLFTQSSVNRRLVNTAKIGGLQNTAKGRLVKKDEHRRVFFDLLVLSRCRHLVATASGYSGLAAALHHDCSERRFLRVKKLDKLTNNLNSVCVPLKPCY